MCVTHRKGFLFDIKRAIAQTSISRSCDRATRRRGDGTALSCAHLIHPLIAYGRTSPVKLFINSALNIQSSPDYGRWLLHATPARRRRDGGKGEDIFESGFMNSTTVCYPCYGSLIGSSYTEKAMKIDDAFIMEYVFKDLILTLSRSVRNASPAARLLFLLPTPSSASSPLSSHLVNFNS